MSDPRATGESSTVYLRRGKRRRAQHVKHCRPEHHREGYACCALGWIASRQSWDKNTDLGEILTWLPAISTSL